MRYAYSGTMQDGSGNRIADGTVSVYLADTTTAASIYTAKSGGTAVNSVTTGTNGAYTFYVDTDDYNLDTQLFDITLTKTNYSSVTLPDVAIGSERSNKIATAASVSSGTHTVTISDGYVHNITATGDFTLAFSFDTGLFEGVLVEAVNWGAHTVTQPASIEWIDGSEPSWTASGKDIVVYWQGYNDVLYGKLSGLDVS